MRKAILTKFIHPVIPGAGSEYIYRSGGYQQCIAQTVKGGHAFCIESVDRMLDYTEMRKNS